MVLHVIGLNIRHNFFLHIRVFQIRLTEPISSDELEFIENNLVLRRTVFFPGDDKIDWLAEVCGEALVRIRDEEVDVCVVIAADVFVDVASLLLTPYQKWNNHLFNVTIPSKAGYTLYKLPF